MRTATTLTRVTSADRYRIQGLALRLRLTSAQIIERALDALLQTPVGPATVGAVPGQEGTLNANDDHDTAGGR